jgi:acyl carrier protein
VLDCDPKSSVDAGQTNRCRPPTGDPVTDLEGLLQRAISKICDIDVAHVRPDARLGDLGVDSLGAAEVLVELEIALGRELPVDVLRRLDHVETVRGIATELQAALGSPSRPLP